MQENKTVVLTRRRRLAIGNVWRHTWLSQLGAATGIWWVEAREASKLPTMHRTPPATKDYPASNVNSAKAETA